MKNTHTGKYDEGIITNDSNDKKDPDRAKQFVRRMARDRQQIFAPRTKKGNTKHIPSRRGENYKTQPIPPHRPAPPPPAIIRLDENT